MSEPHRVNVFVQQIAHLCNPPVAKRHGETLQHYERRNTNFNEGFIGMWVLRRVCLRVSKRHSEEVWEWEKLMAEDDEKRDDAWCTMLEQPHLIEEVPVHTTQAVLNIGYRLWTASGKMSTSRCSVLFQSLLGVPIVNPDFIYYRSFMLLLSDGASK